MQEEDERKNEILIKKQFIDCVGFVTLVTQLFGHKGILLDYSIKSLEILDAVQEEMKAVEWKGIALECLSY